MSFSSSFSGKHLEKTLWMNRQNFLTLLLKRKKDWLILEVDQIFMILSFLLMKRTALLGKAFLKLQNSTKILIFKVLQIILQSKLKEWVSKHLLEARTQRNLRKNFQKYQHIKSTLLDFKNFKLLYSRKLQSS